MNFGRPIRSVKFEGQEHVSTISISRKIIPIDEFCNFAGMDDRMQGDETASREKRLNLRSMVVSGRGDLPSWSFRDVNTEKCFATFA